MPAALGICTYRVLSVHDASLMRAVFGNSDVHQFRVGQRETEREVGASLSLRSVIDIDHNDISPYHQHRREQYRIDSSESYFRT